MKCVNNIIAERLRRKITMDKPNLSIECTVNECRYHSSSCDHCTLDKVCIGSHEAHPDRQQCVDCESFKCANN